MGNYTNIYKSNGTYLGFIWNNFLFSRDGEYLGWLEGTAVWDKHGTYRGQLFEQGGNTFIIVNQLIIQPVPRNPKLLPPLRPALPNPPPNVSPINLPIGFVDAF